MVQIDTDQLTSTRPPAKTVRLDELSITRDGVEYFPHRGESLRFVGEPGNRLVQDVIRFQHLAQLALRDEGGMMSIDEAVEFDRLFDRLRATLKRHIEWWDVSDTFGGKFPSPPTDESIAELPLMELLEFCLALIPEEPEK